VMFIQKAIRRDQLWRVLCFYESLTLCGHYLHNQALKNVEELQAENSTTPFFDSIGRGLAAVSLDHKTWLQAHRYILFNYANIGPYLE